MHTMASGGYSTSAAQIKPDKFDQAAQFLGTCQHLLAIHLDGPPGVPVKELQMIINLLVVKVISAWECAQSESSTKHHA